MIKLTMSQTDHQITAGLRSRKIESIRNSLRKIPIISKNTSKIEQKLKTFNEQQCSPPKRKISHSNSFKSLMQLQESTLFQNKYVIEETIGEGANGFVNKCRKVKTGKTYAVKSSMMDQEHIIGLKENFLAIHALNHPNIVNYYALYIDMRKKLCSIVMQYINLPSLQKVRINDQEQLKEIIYQLLSSVTYLHQKNISHRDLKPQNILYDERNKTIKIIDFGTSRYFIRRQNKLDMLTITGTLFYRAPEMFSGGGYDQKVDIWAAGILIYKLLCGKTPFQSNYLSDTITNIKEQPLHFEEEVWKKTDPALKNLIKKMLKKDKDIRLSAAQCLKDVWFYSLILNKHTKIKDSILEIPQDLPNNYAHCKSFGNLQQHTQDMESMKQYSQKIDGQDFFFFDSQGQEPASTMPSKKLFPEKETKRKKSGSFLF